MTQDIKVCRKSRIMTGERTFVLVNENGFDMGSIYKVATPFAAATKAAMQGYTDIFLYEEDKGTVFSYKGIVEKIPLENLTEFNIKNQIFYKAKVKSTGPITVETNKAWKKCQWNK